jgi:hypothetical protein
MPLESSYDLGQLNPVKRLIVGEQRRLERRGFKPYATCLLHALHSWTNMGT